MMGGVVTQRAVVTATVVRFSYSGWLSVDGCLRPCTKGSTQTGECLPALPESVSTFINWIRQMGTPPSPWGSIAAPCVNEEQVHGSLSIASLSRRCATWA